MGVPYRLDGVLARLSPAVGASLASGPGQRGFGAGASMVFAAGAGIYAQDLFAAFWRDELPIMDWLRDFLCNDEIDRLLYVLANPPDDDDEPEQLFSKAQLATVGSDVIEQF